MSVSSLSSSSLSSSSFDSSSTSSSSSSSSPNGTWYSGAVSSLTRVEDELKPSKLHRIDKLLEEFRSNRNRVLINYEATTVALLKLKDMKDSNNVAHAVINMGYNFIASLLPSTIMTPHASSKQSFYLTNPEILIEMFKTLVSSLSNCPVDCRPQLTSALIHDGVLSRDLPSSVRDLQGIETESKEFDEMLRDPLLKQYFTKRYARQDFKFLESQFKCLGLAAIKHREFTQYLTISNYQDNTAIEVYIDDSASGIRALDINPRNPSYEEMTLNDEETTSIQRYIGGRTHLIRYIDFSLNFGINLLEDARNCFLYLQNAPLGNESLPSDCVDIVHQYLCGALDKPKLMTSTECLSEIISSPCPNEPLPLACAGLVHEYLFADSDS